MINKFLAKSNGLSLVEHTQDVIAAAEELIARLNLTDTDRKYWLDKIVLCAKLHDVGKIHELFQENLTLNTSKNSIRHEVMSLWLVEQFYNLNEDECFAIATHHKGVVQDGEFGRLTETILQAESPILINNFYDFDLLRQFATEWSILFGLADRLKHSDSTNPKFSRENLINLYADYQLDSKNADQRFQFARTRGLLIASDHIGSAQLQNELPTWKKLRTGMFQPKDKKTGRFLPFRSFQKNLRGVKSDVLLYAPTGSGKTEAALGWYFANQEQNGRLFYLLPYTASINAMVSRLQKVFDEKNHAKPKTVTALHSKTLEFFFEELEKEESNHQKNQDRARTMQSFSKELFFPVKVATPHQVLKNALMGKGWEMSLFDYQNACFIIDEFHTYDALMTGLMLTTVKWLKENFNAKIFFMSATIPLFLKELIIERLYEGNQGVFFQPDLLKATDRAILGKKRHKLICCRNESITDKIPLILEFLSLGKSVLIIANNVSTCQQLYNDIDFNGDVKLLHSGFNKRDRIEIEKAITNVDSKSQLLIATQAVEVSLDIDYDIAFIENAPIDALIQRFGRVNRAGKQKSTAPVYIFENIIGNTAKFYDPEVLDATFQNLKKLDGQDLSEEDLVNVCNAVYENGYNQAQQADFEKGFNNSIINNFKEKLVAGHWRYWIEDVLEDNMKIEVLCENLVSEYLKLKDEGRYIEANQLLVSIYFYQTKKNNILDKSVRKRHQVTVVYDLKYNSDIGYTKIENESEIRFN